MKYRQPIPVGVVLRVWESVPTSKMCQPIAVDIACTVCVQQIDYMRTDHVITYNMEACNEVDAILAMKICKNLFLCNRKKNNCSLIDDYVARVIALSSVMEEQLSGLN